MIPDLLKDHNYVAVRMVSRCRKGRRFHRRVLIGGPQCIFSVGEARSLSFLQMDGGVFHLKIFFGSDRKGTCRHA